MVIMVVKRIPMKELFLSALYICHLGNEITETPVIYILNHCHPRRVRLTKSLENNPKPKLNLSVIFVNENENENYQKRKNNDSVNEN